VEFGITFKGDMDPRRMIALCRRAEDAGFDYAWFFDSHVIWHECYTTIAACLRETTRMRFGPCVTNPGVRDWTLAASTVANLVLLGGPRLDLGVGRGDSSVRVLGRRQFGLDTLARFIDSQRALLRGDTISYAGREVRITWSSYELPVWIAAYGPMALATAGRLGDGLIVQLGDPQLCEWFAKQARSAGAAAGRDMAGYRVMAAAPAWVGDIETGRARTRWFPAMVGNHIADLIGRGRSLEGFPSVLLKYVAARKGYDYLHHAEQNADHLAFVTDEITDRLSVLGPIGSHVAKLEELAAGGVTQFNMYLMNGEEERHLDDYGKHIIPRFKRPG
jgi:probable F420-dependent oxidoreductase